MGRADFGIDVAGLGGVVRRANGDVDVRVLDEREFVFGSLELGTRGFTARFVRGASRLAPLRRAEIRTLLSFAGSLARRDRIRSQVADHFVKRNDQILGDRVGIDDDVVARLQIDRVVGDDLCVFADSRVHVPVLTGEGKNGS